MNRKDILARISRQKTNTTMDKMKVLTNHPTLDNHRIATLTTMLERISLILLRTSIPHRVKPQEAMTTMKEIAMETVKLAITHMTVSSSYLSLDQSSGYSGIETNSQEQQMNAYSSNMSQNAANYQLDNSGYREVQKQVSAGGVPVHTKPLNADQRRVLQRQIISLYPDILNRNEAEKVKMMAMFSQMSGMGLIFGTPYSLILFQKAAQESGGSSIRNRLMNKAFMIQLLVIGSSFLSYRSTIAALDQYSDKYLSNVEDEHLLKFDMLDPKIVNAEGNLKKLV